MGRSRRITVIASMRNEGPFIVEWVAWYRMLGFTDVVVVTNHSTDHSPALLEALGKHFRIHHIAYDPPPRASIHMRKIAMARKFRAVRWSEWVFVCDVDEFLVIHKGTGRIEELIGPEGAPPPFTAMAINWRVMGTGGVEAFHDIPVHQQFFTGLSDRAKINCTVKTLFRRPQAFAIFRDHAPAGWDEKAGGGAWGEGDRIWVNADGKPIPGLAPDPEPVRHFPAAYRSFETAQVTHYMVRSAETFSLKAGTKSPSGGVDRYTADYFRRADNGENHDTTALRMAEAFQAEYDRLMALPDVARLHLLCCADHLRLIAEKHGRDPAADPRIRDYLDRAAAMESGAPGETDAPSDAA